LDKITIQFENGQEMKVSGEVDGGILAQVYMQDNEKNIDSECFGNLNNEELLLSGIAAYATAVQELRKRYQAIGEEFDLESLGMTTAKTMIDWGFTEVVEEIANGFDRIMDDTTEEESAGEDVNGFNPLSNLFGISEEQDDNGAEVFHKEVRINHSGTENNPSGYLVVKSTLRKNEENKNIIDTEILGTGQIQDIIELGCAVYTETIDFAKKKVLELDPNANPMMVDMQISQKAAQLIMQNQFGEIGGLVGNLFSGLLNSSDDDENK
jgi:hypothetical protein